MSGGKKEWSFVTGEQLEKIIAQANEIVELAMHGRTKMSVLAIGFAGAAMVRAAAKIMNGDVEWWFDIIRRGGDALERIEVPGGATFSKGPAGKQ